MADIVVRPSTSSDEATVNQLLERSYSTLMQAGYDQVELTKLLPIIGKANPSLLASGTYYLAETATGAIVGSGGWTVERPGDSKLSPALGVPPAPGLPPATAHIRHFATHPGWTGQGVGRAIFDRCAGDARSSGITRFECYASLNAVDFYAKLGFKAIDRIDVPIGGKRGAVDDLVMKAMLMERLL